MFQFLESKSRPELIFIAMVLCGGAVFVATAVYAMVYMR